MRTTRRAIPAAAMAMTLLACVSLAAGETAKKSTGIGSLAGPKSPSGWYSPAEFDSAVHAAETLGQPLAVIYQDSKSTCPKHNGQRDSWMRAAELAAFVRVVVESDAAQPELPQKMRQAAGDRAGKFIPMLFLGTPSGELLGVVAYDTPRPQFQAAIGEALKSFGGVLSPKTAVDLWKKLDLARAHWKKGKTDAALTCYQVVKREEAKNPKLLIFSELRKDEEQINEKGAEEIAAAQALLEKEQRNEARTAIATIRRRYVGFQPAKDAKKLLDTIGASRRDSAAAPIQGKSARRTWSDISGEHQIEAELVAVQDDSARLKKESGDCVSVPIRRLARDDQKYIERWLAEHRKKIGESDATQ